jgi:hypothetical protein
MKSKRVGKGVDSRTLIAPERDDAEFVEHEQREWEAPQSPLSERVDYWSNWLIVRSLPILEPDSKVHET